MKHLTMRKTYFSCLSVIVILLISFSSCKKDDDNNDDPPASTEIVVGKWKATCGFGTFEFTVNPARTYITEFSLKFDSWTMGYSTFNGTMNLSSTPGWQITNRQFSFSKNLNPIPPGSQMMNISGTFNSLGTGASGNWDANYDGITDSGSWTAVPLNN